MAKSIHQLVPDAAHALADSGDLVRIRAALQSAGEAVYDWASEGDQLNWVEGHHDVDAVAAASAHPSGQDFLKCIEEDGRTARERAIRTAILGTRVFQTEYQFIYGANQVSWLEERGTCFLDQDGSLDRIVGIVRDITEQKKRESRLAYLATYDELTGHLNRARLCECLNEALTQVHRFEQPGGYLVVGLDGLGVINESHGYDIADELILHMGERISLALRRNDLMGRIAGNKFGVVLPNSSEDEMRLVAERLLDAVRATPFDTKAGKVITTISIGAVVLDENVQSSQEAMGRAQEAVDNAKRNGRDCCVVHHFSPDSIALRLKNRETADAIVSALNEDRMVLVYQPIISSGDGKPEMYECLVRMRRKDGGLVGAGEFIPLAEQMGLIRLIDQRVLKLVIAEARRTPEINFTFNISGHSFRDGPWMSHLIDLLGENAEVCSRLVVEITETLALHDLEESAAVVRRLRDIGCRVAIDDFGAGFTSFKNLQRLEVDIVKIDGAFVKGLIESQANQLFVKTLTALAKNFGCRVIAEWVETEAEADLLRDFGIDLLQGFYFGAGEVGQPWNKWR